MGQGLGGGCHDFIVGSPEVLPAGLKSLTPQDPKSLKIKTLGP